MTLKLGYFVPNFMAAGITVETLAGLARTIDRDTRFDDAWVGDHVVTAHTIRSRHPHFGHGTPPGTPMPFTEVGLGGMDPDDPVFEPLTLLAYLAGQTRRVRLGVGVLVAPLRNPVLTAKMLSIIDLASGGRLTVAVGTGWLREEFEALEVDWNRRGTRTEDYMACMRHLWSSAEKDFRSEHAGVESNTRMFPKPAQPGGIPIWVGGNSAPALKRAARAGDGWHGAQLSPEDAGTAIRTLRDELGRQERSGASFTMSLRLTCWLTTSNAAKAPDPLVGTSQKIIDRIAEYVRAGVQHIQLAPPPMRDIAEIQEQAVALDRSVLGHLTGSPACG